MTKRVCHQGGYVEVEDDHTGPVADGDIVNDMRSRRGVRTQTERVVTPEPADDGTEAADEPESSGLTAADVEHLEADEVEALNALDDSQLQAKHGVAVEDVEAVRAALAARVEALTAP